MNTSSRIKILPLLFCALVLASCADLPETTSGENMKLETITRAPGTPPTYVYRKTTPDQ